MVHLRQEDKRDACKHLSDNGMHSKSARHYITAILAMLDGGKYGSTINEQATRYFLDNILKDFGAKRLSIALDALLAHIEYQKRKNNLPSLMKIHIEYLTKI